MFRKKSEKTEKNGPAAKTLATLLLDRSASMGRLRESTVSGINGWLEEQRASGEDIRVSFLQFDRWRGQTCIEKVHVARRIAEVPALTMNDFHPRGDTPLLDAVMDTILAIRESLKGPRGDGVKVVVAIQTDGDENASTRWSWEAVKAEIAAREEDGWKFVFMGAGIGESTYEMGARMGISPENTIAYSADAVSTREVFRATGQNTALFASGTLEDVGYTAAQRSASGERRAVPAASPVPPSRPSAPLGGVASPALPHQPMGGGYFVPRFTPADFPSIVPVQAMPPAPLDLSLPEDDEASPFTVEGFSRMLAEAMNDGKEPGA
ncbi:VWA domain-containing protein [Cereibacter sphaeroides]|uniref:vWA domain-containing protein n=1 Tax=Cereibacter sphaeroides TaxID=1063 RepID=UPI001F202457|nr:vWA domain-containing protein [Cereibacter sphaeroides]MCE6958770.1 VWA domain-containing protein [Cereibacter sphaeroides]MCE6973356.1 VWA domain-containing protein [Cereibacter sphaeroides]